MRGVTSWKNFGRSITTHFSYRIPEASISIIMIMTDPILPRKESNYPQSLQAAAARNCR